MREEKKTVLRHYRAIVSYEDRVKARLAAELHDEFGASLAAITIQLQSITTRDRKIMAALRKTENYIASLTPRLRSIFHDLMPSQLEQYGLRTSVYHMVGKAIENGKMKVHITLTNVPPPKDIQLHLYRIIQELFTNILKHSSASECNIELQTVDRGFRLRIQDNGIGYSAPAYVHAPSGLGLINVFSRIKLLNASVNLNTAPGKGAEYIIEIPCLCTEKKSG